MACVDIPDDLFRRLRSAAYDRDLAPDDLGAGLLCAALSKLRGPKPKAAQMAELRERRRREQYGVDYRDRLCEGCGGEMARYALPNARYCCDRCRQRAYRERKTALATAG